MLSAIVKPLETLTAADLGEIVERQWPESENIEYKAELHRERKDSPDPWYINGNISVPSKNKIFKELVAFANTSGGRLFLGVKETPDKPPRADSIQPIPRCCDLAERLEQSIISSIDPPLTFFRVVGVPTDGDSGVVVAEVAASYSGPHRSPDLHCYVRKGTNSVPVGMREIHDIVMRLSRRQDEVQRRFTDRRDRFRLWLGDKHPLIQKLKAAFRATAVPIGAPLYVDRVFNNRDVSRGFNGGRGTWRRNGTKAIADQFLSPINLSERRVLGGAAWTASRSDDTSGTKVIHRDGLIDIWFQWPWYSDHGAAEKPILQFNWVVAAAADAIASADGFRRAAQSPACEYGLQLELYATNGAAEVPVNLVVNRMGFMESLDSAIETPVVLGLYSIGDANTVINAVVRDLLDAGGEAHDWPDLEIDWTSVRN